MTSPPQRPEGSRARRRHAAPAAGECRAWRGAYRRRGVTLAYCPGNEPQLVLNASGDHSPARAPTRLPHTSAMNLGLGGRGVLVTGASGAIGTATARAFADEGARVAVHYHRNREAAADLAEEIAGVALCADLTSEVETGALAAAARDRLGTLDVCVANAGVRAGADLPLRNMPLER